MGLMTMYSVGAKNECQLFNVIVGSPLLLDASGYSIPYPLTIRAKPGSGGTLLIEYRISTDGDFIAWPAGTVSSAKVYVLTGPVEALRFTATTADGVVEIAQ